MLIDTLAAFGIGTAFQRQGRCLFGEEPNVLVRAARRAAGPHTDDSNRVPRVDDVNMLTVLEVSGLCGRKTAPQQEHYFS
jgi:hypothetical protein